MKETVSKIARGWQGEIDKDTESHRDSELREGEKVGGGNSNRDIYRKTVTEKGMWILKLIYTYILYCTLCYY